VTSWCSNPGPLKAFRRVDGFRELEETAKVCLSQVTTFPSFLHAVQSLVHACNVIYMHAKLSACMQRYLHACNVIMWLFIPMDSMTYSFVNFVTFKVAAERKCHICDMVELNKLTLPQVKTH
jgi:hypothetical protein